MAFAMKADLSGPGVTPASALLAVEGAMPSFELIDFRMSGKPRGTDFVADGVLANAVVLGGPPTPVSGLDLSVAGMVYEENGQRIATAAADAGLGNPRQSLAGMRKALGKLARERHA